jgi:catalase
MNTTLGTYRHAPSFLLGRIVSLAAAVALASLQSARSQDSAPPKASAKDMVDALHTAFGEHHARAVHTKGVMLEGSFDPAPDAKTLTKEPIFAGGMLPVVARFSLFAGVPNLPDTDDGASPAGFGVKIKAKDGDDFDIESNQHKDFITATTDEFRTFLQAVGAAGKGDKEPLGAFLESHPHARDFLASRTYPASYATATYFGINALKFTNEKGQSVFVRYRFVPRAGEKYQSPEERKAQGPNYLQEEIVKRVSENPIMFDWYAQVAEVGDKIEDPSIAWPETRKLVKLGSFTLAKLPADPEAAQLGLLFLPGQPHPGVEPADPMLVLRNKAYPISFKERQ